MTIEDRIKRLEKIILVLEPCIPQSRYARESGLSSADVIETKNLLADIKKELGDEEPISCKSCKYCDLVTTNQFDNSYCRYHGAYTGRDRICPYYERRTDEDTSQ